MKNYERFIKISRRQPFFSFKSKQGCCTLGQLIYLCLVEKEPKYRSMIFYKDYFEEFFVIQPDKV